MTAPGERLVAVPDGLDGERLDAALARMFGLSRSRAAELIGDGLVLLGGRTAAKSAHVSTVHLWSQIMRCMRWPNLRWAHRERLADAWRARTRRW